MKVRFLFVLMLGIVLAASTGVAGTTEGEITMTIKSAALGIGHSAGEGILKYGGKEYPFKVEGFSVGNVGTSTVHFTGYVHDLKNVSDFTDIYRGEGLKMETVGGDMGVRLKSEKGVTMDLIGSVEGFAIRIGQQGIKITLR